MTAPTPGPTSLDQVLAARPQLASDAAAVGAAVDAVNSLVAGWLSPAGDGEWAAHHRYGATLLAVRVYSRKDSPFGVLEQSTGAAYVQRNDPDIAQLLGLGPYAPPRVG